MVLPTISCRTTRAPLIRRLRFVAVGTCCALILAWIVSFAPFDDLMDCNGGPLGGDYAMFYLGGEFVAVGEATKLYDLAAHHQRFRELFPRLGNDDLLPYRYPPFVAAAFVPLAKLPFAASWVVFTLVSCATGYLGWRCLRATEPPQDEFAAAVSLALLACPVTWEVIIGGQGSFFAFAIAASSLWLLSQQRFLAAGAVLGLACYKPNVLAFYLLGCVLRHPRVLWGMLPTIASLALISWLAVGWEGCLTYATLGQSLMQRTWDIPTPYWKVHGLAAWFDLLAPGWGKISAFAAGLTAVGLWKWQTLRQPAAAGSAIWQQDFALLLTINTLCNPYPPLYDLVLLAIPLYLAIPTQQSQRESTLSAVAVVVFFGPHLSQAFSHTLHVQLFTLPLLAFAFWQMRRRVDTTLESIATNASSDVAPAIPASVQT